MPCPMASATRGVRGGQAAAGQPTATRWIPGSHSSCSWYCWGDFLGARILAKSLETRYVRDFLGHTNQAYVWCMALFVWIWGSCWWWFPLRDHHGWFGGTLSMQVCILVIVDCVPCMIDYHQSIIIECNQHVSIKQYYRHIDYWLYIIYC